MLINTTSVLLFTFFTIGMLQSFNVILCVNDNDAERRCLVLRKMVICYRLLQSDELSQINLKEKMFVRKYFDFG